MNKNNDTWNSDIQKSFSNTNHIIIKATGKKELDDEIEWSFIKSFLAFKEGDEIYFFDGKVETFYDLSYKYDNNLNLQILNC